MAVELCRHPAVLGSIIAAVLAYFAILIAIQVASQAAHDAVTDVATRATTEALSEWIMHKVWPRPPTLVPTHSALTHATLQKLGAPIGGSIMATILTTVFRFYRI